MKITSLNIIQWRERIARWWDRNAYTIIPWLVIVPVVLFIVGVAAAFSEIPSEDICDDPSMYVKEITVRGKTHEYLMNRYMITHLPNCKYCTN